MSPDLRVWENKQVKCGCWSRKNKPLALSWLQRAGLEEDGEWVLSVDYEERRRKRGRERKSEGEGDKCLWAGVDLQCLNSPKSLIEVCPWGCQCCSTLWNPVLWLNEWGKALIQAPDFVVKLIFFLKLHTCHRVIHVSKLTNGRCPGLLLKNKQLWPMCHKC